MSVARIGPGEISMKRVARVTSWAGCLLLLVLVAPGLRGQEDKDAKPARVLVKCVEDDTELTFNDTPTKATGATRRFSTPPLKPGKRYFYTVKAIWRPNNYETFTRIRKLYVEPGKEVVLDLTVKAKP